MCSDIPSTVLRSHLPQTIRPGELETEASSVSSGSEAGIEMQPLMHSLAQRRDQAPDILQPTAPTMLWAPDTPRSGGSEPQVSGHHVIDMPAGGYPEPTPQPATRHHELDSDVEAGREPAPIHEPTEAEVRTIDARLLQLAKAGLSQGMATAATFGVRPFAQLAVREALRAAGLANHPAFSLMVAALSGPFAGFIHTVVGRAVAAGMNSALGAETYKLRPGQDALLHEIGTIDLPVMVAFDATYAIRGAMVGGSPDWITDAVSKSVASAAGGVLQGVITDALKQAMSSAYERVKPKEDDPSSLKAFTAEFKKQLNRFANVRNPDGNYAHDFLAKVFGSAIGDMMAAGAGMMWANHEAAHPAAANVVGMQLYLMGWFGLMHAAHAEQQALQGAAPAPSATAASGAATGAPAAAGEDRLGATSPPPFRDLEAGPSQPEASHTVSHALWNAADSASDRGTPRSTHSGARIPDTDPAHSSSDDDDLV